METLVGLSSASQPTTVTTSVHPQYSLCMPSPPAGRGRPVPANFSVDSTAYHRYLLDRRKSFRARGSLGPTVASAPSVEQEDYRTPRPSVSAIKNGKSFDFGGYQRDSACSDTNGLIKVSADFLRLNGSRQQFRNLLSARKKLGTMPPAYTRIDCSHESLDSAPTRPQGPVITVEDTGSQLQIHRGSLAVSGTVSLAENPPTECENGNGSAIGVPPASPFKRNNSRYGIPIDDCAVKMVYRIRSERLNTRVAITDRSLVLALVGIVFMVIDAELCGQNLFEIDKSHPVSLLIRTFVFLSTTTLLTHIVYFHANEISLELVDCGADDWRIVVTWSRIYQFLSEFVICSICPLPGTGELTWTFVEANRCASHHGSHDNYSEKKVPVDVLLSLLMILRVYLLGRFMVLHSKQFQDASTRTLAALNRIQVNFSFVMKTMLDQRPLLLLSVFTLFFWLATAWTFAQCERLGRDHETPSILYANALWFIAITFLLNGYGDIVPKTNCGRIIAIVVGIIGAIISSILIAVISKKILLSQGQRNVNHFMNDSRLTREQKEAAAKVLQQTWHIYKCQTNAVPNRHLRYYQRKFLKAIHEFRHIKNKIRTFGETSSNTSIQQMNRLMIELQNTMARLVSAQDEIRVQIEVLQRTVRNHFVSGDGSSQRIMFAESISDQGP